MLLKIEQESKMVKAGKEAWIIIKVNSLIDPEIIQALYKASQAGVKIDLIVYFFQILLLINKCKKTNKNVWSKYCQH